MKLGATRCADGGRQTVQVLDLRADFADCECVRHNLMLLEGPGDDSAVRLIHS